MNNKQGHGAMSGIKVVGVKSVRRYKCGYEVRDEVWEHHPDEELTPIRAAYTPSGDYIGDTKTARRLVAERGIQPIKRSHGHCVCSIGYSVKDGKWYGWSHRAIFGFKIGSTCKIGDCHYLPHSLGGRGKWTAKTISDAKQMAVDFASGVS